MATQVQWGTYQNIYKQKCDAKKKFLGELNFACKNSFLAAAISCTMVSLCFVLLLSGNYFKLIFTTFYRHFFFSSFTLNAVQDDTH